MRPTHLRLVSSREPEPDSTLDADLTEIAAGVADTAIEQCNRAGQAVTADYVTTICIHLFGHAVDKGAELREVIRRCWTMVAERQEESRRLVAGRPATSMKPVHTQRGHDVPDDQMVLPGFGGAPL